MKKFLLLIGILVGWMTIAYSQVVTVTDNKTGETISDVTLMSAQPNVFTTTNVRGKADISTFSGSNAIVIRTLGYKTVTLSFDAISVMNFEIQLEQTNLNLDEVVVSANRWQQLTTDIPQKISTITPQTIGFQTPQTAGDLLTLSGKVYMQKSQLAGGSPMIRGFATNRLLYTIDGVRLNSAILRSGNVQNVINFDPFAMEKTEVVYGPGSVIYGSDAIGGVMGFQTLTPQFSLTDDILVTGKAVARHSTANNEKTGHFDVNVGWKKWASVTSFSSWDFGDLRQGSHGPMNYIKPVYVETLDKVDYEVKQRDPLIQNPSAYSQYNLMQKIRYQPDKNLDLQYGFHYSETSPYGRYDKTNRVKSGKLRYAEQAYGAQIWMMNNLAVRHKTENFIYDDLTLRLTWQQFEENRMSRDLNKLKRGINQENVNAYAANLDFAKSLGKKNKLYYGAEIIYDDVTSKGTTEDVIANTVVPGSHRYPESTWYSAAFYINDDFKLNDMISVIGGLRYNHIGIYADFSKNLAFYPFPFRTAKSNKGSFTGSIGTVFHPDETWLISANFGTAFRAPNVDDIGKVFDSELGGVTVPNPDLKPEYAYSYDFGIAKVFGDVAKVDLSAFYTTLDQAMVKRDFQLNGQSTMMYGGVLSTIQAIQNAASAYVYGIQASIDLNLTGGFLLSSDFTYQYGKEELDDGSESYLRHSPPPFGVTRLKYRGDRLHLEFYSEYMLERDNTHLAFGEKSKTELYALKKVNGVDVAYAPTWYTFNIKAGYALSEMFTINAGVENLADQRYRPYSSGISRAGRNFIISLTTNF